MFVVTGSTGDPATARFRRPAALFLVEAALSRIAAARTRTATAVGAAAAVAQEKKAQNGRPATKKEEGEVEEGKPTWLVIKGGDRPTRLTLPPCLEKGWLTALPRRPLHRRRQDVKAGWVGSPRVTLRRVLLSCVCLGFPKNSAFRVDYLVLLVPALTFWFDIKFRWGPSLLILVNAHKRPI